MDERRLKLLLDKHHDGRCSSEEEAELFHWYQGFNEEEQKKLLEGQPVEKEALRTQLLERLHEKINGTTAPRSSNRLSIFWKISAAAAVILLVLGAGFLYRQSRHHVDYIVIKTPPGEVKEVWLPDSSHVWLNAMSVFKYPKKFAGENRVVFLEKGEAFFDIAQEPTSPFHVLCDTFQVEVLGTAFDVNVDGDVKKVMLKSGKVRVRFEQYNKKVALKPGELLTYDITNHKVTKFNVNAVDYVAWKEKMRILHSTTVAEIAHYIEAFYRRPVRIEDTVIKYKKMDGTLMLDKLEDVLFVLRASLDIDIIQKGDTLVFKEKE